MNGKESLGKRTIHFDIKCFYITDLIKRKEVSIKFCPSNDMIADFYITDLIKRNVVSIKFCPSNDMIVDYLTKPLVGKKFFIQRGKIMNNKD